MKYNKFITYKQFKEKESNLISKLLIDRTLPYEMYIKDTKEYQRYIYLYKDILKSMKEMIELLRIDNTLDFSILYTYFLLPNGILSISDKVRYRNEECNNTEFLNTMGGKVITGNAVCRHIAKMLIDLCKFSNLEAYFVAVKCNDNPKDGHALVGLIDEDKKKYIVDPTNQMIGFYQKNKITCYDLKGKDKNLIFYTDDKNYKDCNNLLNYLDYSDYSKHENKCFFGDVSRSYEKTLEKYELFKDYFLFLKEKNIEEYKEITILLEKLCGYEYEPKIKKLIR